MAANGNTLIQATVPDELRGRVISVYTTVFAGSTPTGAPFSGDLAARRGGAPPAGPGGGAARGQPLQGRWAPRSRPARVGRPDRDRPSSRSPRRAGGRAHRR